MKQRRISFCFLISVFSLLLILPGSIWASTWAVTYPPTGNGIGQFAIPLSDSGVVVGGDVNTHGFVAKLNAGGQFVWQHTYGASVISHFYDGCSVSDGYLLTGSITNNSILSVWIMKLNLNGDSLWSRIYGGNLASEGYAIKPALNGFIVAGKCGVSGRGDDGWLLRCNSVGDTLWTRKLGGLGDDKFTGISMIPDSNHVGFIATGSKTINASTDFWMVRLIDSSGVYWDSTYGGSYNDDGQDAIPLGNAQLVENFGGAFPPSNWEVQNRDTSYTWVLYPGTQSWARLNNYYYDGRGQLDFLITPTVSTIGLTSAELDFNWSYALASPDNNDSLELAYSIDNWTTYTTLWVRGANDTASLVAGTGGSTTTPATSNFGFARVSLPAGALMQPSVRFGFINHAHYGCDIFVTNVEFLPSCNYLAVGYSNSVTGNPNNKNLLIKKFDNRGTTVWSHDYGLTPNEYGHRILMNSDGTFYIVGTSNSTDSQEGGSLSIWKCLVSNGDTLWQHTYGNSYSCIGRAMAISPTHNIFVAGAIGTISSRSLGVMKLDSMAAITTTLTISPFTNSYFRVGDTTTFRWSHNAPGTVRLELNRNYPSGSWSSLVTNTTADSFRWVVTSPVAATCKVRATIIGFLDSATVVSDSSFAIVQPSVHVVAPNGGEMWPVSSTQSISWTSQFITNERIVISLQRGASQPTVLDTTAVANGSINWTVVAPTSNSCRIVLTMIGGSTSATDQSDTTFQIVNRLHITHPLNNQAIQVGVNDTVRWISSNVPDSIIVELKRNYPSGTWEVLGITDHNPGMFVWQPNLPLSGNTAIRISNYPDLSLRDTSAMFQILRPTITITFPNSVEHLRPGNVQDIQWNSTNVTGFVRIQLNRHYPDTTRNWETLFDSTQNDGEQLWIVNAPSTVTARVRITSIYNPTVSDTSDNNFEIIDTTNAVKDALPKSFQLGAYPNPFNSQIRIGYRLEHTSEVRATIYDIFGREVFRSEKQPLNAGFHSFDWNAGTAGVSAGIYYCRIEGNGVSQLYKMVYLK